MIYHLSLYLKSYWSLFNVFHYVSVRAIASLLSSLFLSLLLGNWFINQSEKFFRSKAREWTPKGHKAKDGMPTMGGIFILGIILLNCLLWTDLSQWLVWIFLFCIVSFGAIGCWDDWCKIRYHKGISARVKFSWQIFFGTIVVLFWLCSSHAPTTLVFPFFKHMQPDIGWLFVLWAVFVLIGCSNAVNLTDGLDGLAIGSLIPNFVLFSLICYVAGHYNVAHYLAIPFTGSAELTIVGAILVGASLGFLWFNTYPAQIFMGDVGSLALGSALACMALFAKQEFLLLISGGLFVLETVSVILQVLSMKWRGKRIFKMAPIHHHFELLGWQESKITVRFAIISLVLCLLALITLKLR
ncbi:MAG: phospho-N-acetylmuramoyl-pentapeptide-transferase [Candidatus Babeliales bacterium]|jgi:phospho-N-acetylmuramoyl-pentapeptide-transferase